jgi:hypothetical protein
MSGLTEQELFAAYGLTLGEQSNARSEQSPQPDEKTWTQFVDKAIAKRGYAPRSLLCLTSNNRRTEGSV